MDCTINAWRGIRFLGERRKKRKVAQNEKTNKTKYGQIIAKGVIVAMITLFWLIFAWKQMVWPKSCHYTSCEMIPWSSHYLNRQNILWPYYVTSGGGWGGARRGGWWMVLRAVAEDRRRWGRVSTEWGGSVPLILHRNEHQPGKVLLTGLYI